MKLMARTIPVAVLQRFRERVDHGASYCSLLSLADGSVVLGTYSAAWFAFVGSLCSWNRLEAFGVGWRENISGDFSEVEPSDRKYRIREI